jgi:hypothetical protein
MSALSTCRKSREGRRQDKKEESEKERNEGETGEKRREGVSKKSYRL